LRAAGTISGWSTRSAWPTPYGQWNIHGGHRFWLAPETLPETYYPGDEDVSIVENGGGVSVSQDIPVMGIRKELVLSYLGKNKVQAVHNVHNTGAQTKELAAWALSLMRTGGFAIVPQNLRKEDEHGFLPNRNLVLWIYTNVLDKRLKTTPKLFYIKQGGPKPFKIGQRVTLGSPGSLRSSGLVTAVARPRASPRCDFHREKREPGRGSQ
jgi:hypothetical protein